jgi:hypothetical protein
MPRWHWVSVLAASKFQFQLPPKPYHPCSEANLLQTSGLLDPRFFAAILPRSGFGKNPEGADIRPDFRTQFIF